MSAGEPGSGYGTVYHPDPDLVPNGEPQTITSAQLRSLPRRRRPGMIALAVALVGAGILASAALYQREDHQVPVLLVTADVPAGAVITAADVGTASVAAGPGVTVIPASQLRRVIGLTAATSLRPGSLLTPPNSRPPCRRSAARYWFPSRSARRDCRPAGLRRAITWWWCRPPGQQAAALAARALPP